MFKNEDVLEFLTRIVKNSNSQNLEKSKESIEKFTEYLRLTTMCDEKTLNAIANVSECFDELVAIYEKTGVCNLNLIFNSKNKIDSKDEEIEEEKTPVLVKKRTFDKPYQEKHYDRYISTKSNYGSSCGSGGSYGSSC